MRKLLLNCLISSCIGAAQAQPTPTGMPALDQLTAALSAKSVAPLQVYLTPDTRIGSLPAAYTAQVLAQLVSQFGAVEAFRVVRQMPDGPNTRYVCALTQQGTAKAYEFVLTPDGKFAELNLAPASVKKISTTFRPEDLISPPSLAVPMRLVEGLILVEAEVDGRRGTFVLDTGAPGLFLNQREFLPPAAQATLAPAGPRDVNGAVGGISYHVVAKFDWAGLGFANKEVATIDVAGIEAQVHTSVLGLIGYGLLSQYALTLDYRGGQVLLRKPTAAPALPAPLMRVPFTLRGHLPVVDLTANSQTFRVALDCGAQQNLLDQQYASAFAPVLRYPEQATLRGADQLGRAVVSGELPKVRLAGGPLVFRHQATVFADISHLNRNGGAPVL